MPDIMLGYGSIFNKLSRNASGTTGTAHPAYVSNLSRGWTIQSRKDRYTGLGAQLVPEAMMNCVLVEIEPTELWKFDVRELVHGYAKILVETNAIRSTSEWTVPSDANVWAYTTTQPRMASREYPISQHYLDICMLGCLDYGVAFAEDFVRTTDGWSYPWLNDRTNPRRTSDASTKEAKQAADKDDCLEIVDQILARVRPLEFSRRLNG